MTTHISPRETADRLVADYTAIPDPLADTERTDGIMVMHHNNEGIEDVRDSALRAEELGEIRRLNYRGDNA